jgi:hypothetical protein
MDFRAFLNIFQWLSTDLIVEPAPVGGCANWLPSGDFQPIANLTAFSNTVKIK